MLRLPLLAAAAIALSSAAPAQYNSYGYFSTPPIQMSVNQMNWYNMSQWNNLAVELRKRGYSDEQIKDLSYEQMKALVEKGSKPGKAKPAPSKPAKAAAPAAPATRYTPTGKRTTMNAVVNALTQDKEHRDGLRTLFSAGIAEFEKAGKAAKMPNDLALAMAFFVSAAYALEGEEVSDDASIMLAHGLRDLFDTPSMRKASSAEKEAFSEFLVVMGTFLIASKEQLDPQADKATLDALRSTAGDVLKKFLNLDMKQYRVTNYGLAKRG